MKYQEKSSLARTELGAHLERIIGDLLSGKLVVEGTNVDIPDDLDLKLKVKFSIDEESGSIAIKIGWKKPVEKERESEVF